MHILTKVAPGWPKPPPSLAAVIAHGEYETWPRGRIIYEQPPDRVCHLRRSATAGCPASPPDQDPLPLAASANDRARRPALPQHTLHRDCLEIGGASAGALVSCLISDRG
jgi:hypothetical protein